MILTLPSGSYRGKQWSDRHSLRSRTRIVASTLFNICTHITEACENWYYLVFWGYRNPTSVEFVPTCPLLQLQASILQMLFDHFQESDYDHWATTGLLILDFQVPVIYNSNTMDMWICMVEQFYHPTMHVEVQCHNRAVNMVINLWVT